MNKSFDIIWGQQIIYGITFIKYAKLWFSMGSIIISIVDWELNYPIPKSNCYWYGVQINIPKMAMMMMKHAHIEQCPLDIVQSNIFKIDVPWDILQQLQKHNFTEQLLEHSLWNCSQVIAI